MKKLKLITLILMLVLVFSTTSYAASSSSIPKSERMTLSEMDQRIKTLGNINKKGSLIYACFDSIVIYKVKKMLDSDLDITSSLEYYETKLVNYENELADLIKKKTALTQ